MFIRPRNFALSLRCSEITLTSFHSSLKASRTEGKFILRRDSIKIFIVRYCSPTSFSFSDIDKKKENRWLRGINRNWFNEPFTGLILMPWNFLYFFSWLFALQNIWNWWDGGRPVWRWNLHRQLYSIHVQAPLDRLDCVLFSFFCRLLRRAIGPYRVQSYQVSYFVDFYSPGGFRFGPARKYLSQTTNFHSHVSLGPVSDHVKDVVLLLLCVTIANNHHAHCAFRKRFSLFIQAPEKITRFRAQPSLCSLQMSRMFLVELLLVLPSPVPDAWNTIFRSS